MGLILSILGLVFGAAAALLWVRWNNMPASGIDALDRLMAMVDKGSYYRTLATLITDAVACAINGVLLWFAHSYLAHELADGTPFPISPLTYPLPMGWTTPPAWCWAWC